jgi:hypothetical protein
MSDRYKFLEGQIYKQYVNPLKFVSISVKFIFEHKAVNFSFPNMYC